MTVTAMDVLFIVFAALSLGSALMVVTTRKMVHAALWLIVALFGIAAIYVILNAPFLAVVQVVVYIGAIAILMIFAVMLTRDIGKPDGEPFNQSWGWAVLISLLFVVGLIIVYVTVPEAKVGIPEFPQYVDSISDLGQALVNPNAYVLPFELASVLLLAALIGAIVIARRK